MTTELPKTYDPSAVEAKAYQVWLDEKCFHADPSGPGEAYCIVIPPPNVTGALHLGHAINGTLQDILVRKARMEGKNTLWIPGIDHAGIATQAVVEKQLKEKENLDRYSVGREGLVKRIWEWKAQYGDRIIAQLKRLGCSCDWDRTRFTLDEMCAKAVRETFFKLFKDGLVYRGKRLVNWDTHLQTSISDDEIYHETVKTSLWHIRYRFIDEQDGVPNEGRKWVPLDRPKEVVVATTRPETMLGDTAVAVHSEDPRWNWAIGKFVELPLTGRKIPIIADDILVDPKFGTGCVKVTPAHDPNDYAVWQRHQGKPDQIDLINLLNPDGTVNDNAGAYKGLKLEVARKKVVSDLEHQGLLVKEEPYETQVGHSDRSKTPIQPYLSDQWFVKMAPLAEPALEVVRDGTIKFFPERHAQQYLAWLGEKRDWPISRQLWWGHRIPIWSCDLDLPTDVLAGPAAGHENDARVVAALDRSIGGDFDRDVKGLGWYHMWIEGHPDRADAIRVYICIRDENSRLAKKLESAGFVQDPDVLDTWFSSALWPHSTLGWPETDPSTPSGQALAKWYPTSVLLTGRDIITLWVARMVMMGMYNMGNQMSEEGGVKSEESAAASSHSSLITPHSSGIPFHHVAINPTILDGKGERMSKSKGNGVDPVDVIETHGADALRFTMTSMATETQDVRMPVKKLPDGRNTSDKFDLGRNFCNKLWNASRFVLSNLEAIPFEAHTDGHPWALADRWILSRFNATVAEANRALSVYRFDQYATACYDFFWRDFCDWYVEIVKPTLKTDAGKTSADLLARILDGALRLMHPMIPFITETLWWKLNEVRPIRAGTGTIHKRLVRSEWPKAGVVDQAAEQQFARLQELIVAIRNVRNEHKADPRKSVVVSIVAAGDSARSINENKAMIELLGTCTIQAVASQMPAPANSVRVTASGCDIYIEGLVDPEADKQRTIKRREDLTRQVAQLKGRLANQGYMAKAPPQLVKQTNDQLAEAEEELGRLG